MNLTENKINDINLKLNNILNSPECKNDETENNIKEVENLNKEKDLLSKKIETINQQKKNKNMSIKDIEDSIKKLKSQLDDSTKGENKIKSWNKLIDKTQKDMKSNNKEIINLSKSVDNMNNKLIEVNEKLSTYKNLYSGDLEKFKKINIKELYIKEKNINNNYLVNEVEKFSKKYNEVLCSIILFLQKEIEKIKTKEEPSNISKEIQNKFCSFYFICYNF